jgi:hypothetical protein
MRVARVVHKLYGRPCWNVRPGFGSFLTLEFGEPHLEIREPIAPKKNIPGFMRKSLGRRGVYLCGDWRLWIYCCDWEVLSGRKRIGDSSRKVRIRKAAEFLNGQKMTHFSISPRKVICTFRFDLGGILRTMPYDTESEQWMLYEPSHKVLVVRADGRCAYEPSHLPDDATKWKVISG